MQTKKYQVFISSTYSDLIEERKRAIDAILLANCMPAGMEAFAATDENQFSVIKRVIDLCDYYVLIIGNRYGSIFPGKNISYTEMEYEYAISAGIPVLAFIIDDSVISDISKCDNDKSLMDKLQLFKERVKNNRLVDFWRTKDELFGKIIASLHNALTQFDRPGWVRGSLLDANVLLEENQHLRETIENYENNLTAAKTTQSSYENIVFPMHYSETVYFLTSGMRIGEKDISPTLGDLFKHVSLSLTSPCSYKDFTNAINDFVVGYHTNDTTIKKLKGQFLIFGLIKEESKIINKNPEIYINLTDFGIQEMKRLNKMG